MGTMVFPCISFPNANYYSINHIVFSTFTPKFQSFFLPTTYNNPIYFNYTSIISYQSHIFQKILFFISHHFPQSHHFTPIQTSPKSNKTATEDALNELGGESSPTRRKASIAANLSSDSSRSESGSESDSSDEGSAYGWAMGESDEDVPGSEKLTYEDIKEVFMEPFFEELIVGCFVRVGIGMSGDKVSIYTLCMVRNVDAAATWAGLSPTKLAEHDF